MVELTAKIGEFETFGAVTFYASDNIEADLFIKIYEQTIHYKIRHLTKESSDILSIGININESKEIGYIDIINYKLKNVITGTNSKPLMIAKGTNPNGLKEEFYIQMTLNRIANDKELLNLTPNPENLWLYSIVLLKKEG